MRKRLPFIAALAGVAVIAVVATLLISGGGDDKAEPLAPALKGGKQLSADKLFKLHYPKGWEKVSNTDLGVANGAPVAAIRRSDGTAQMIVQRAGKLSESLTQVSSGLTKRLTKQIKDFKLVKAGRVKIPAGTALSYTFARTKTGQVQNLTVVPQGDKTYTLNSVVAGSSQAAAREVAAIIRSFDPA